MTDPATRNFMSQWSYDRDQDRENPRDKTTMQWLSVDRVAEQIRQLEEHHVDNDFDTLDFETRAAALEAHFFQATGRDSPPAGWQSTPAKKVVRARPQSASLARRAPETNATSNRSNEFAPRQRPQSAKTRSEMSCTTNATQTQNEVTWKPPIQQNPSKWREMLARGPEFKQRTLRRLELETYELLYNTLQQQQAVEAKPRTRRRKRRSNENGADKPLGHSPALACGSGLHLARSRKKRQQEHDRQMMLGKGRQPSRASEQDKVKSAREDKQAIQDKTRRRSKLLSKKPPERQLQELIQPVNQVSKHDKQRYESSLQRQSSAPITARVPWVPSGSASSLAIRGISSETSEAHLTQEKRIAQVLEAFQSQAKSHLRLSMHVQDQLKKTQQYAKIAKANDSRRIEKAIKGSSDSKNHLKRACPGSAVKQSSNRGIDVDAPVSQGNQENDLANHADFRGSTWTVPVLNTLQSASESEPLFSASPRTPKLIVPLLKLPPNLWEYQSINDGLSETSCHDQASITFRYAGTDAHSQVSPAADSTRSPGSENARDNLSTDEAVDSKSKTSGIEEGVRPGGVRPNELDDYGEQKTTSARRRESATIEEGYLAEGLTEQANIGLSSEDTEPSPVEFPQESLEKEVIPLVLIPLGDNGRVTNELAGPGNGNAIDPESNSAVQTPTSLSEGGLTVSTSEGARSVVTLLTLEIAMSPTKEIGVQLAAEVPPFAQEAASADTRDELPSDLDVNKIVQNVEVCEEQQDPPCSNKSAVDLVGCQENVDSSASLAATAHPGAHDFQLVSQDSFKVGREENVDSRPMVTNGIDVAMLPAPNCDGLAESQERIEHRHRDSDPSTCVTSREMLYVRSIADHQSTSKHEPALSKSDSKNTHAHLRGNRAELLDANEVAPARTSRTTDAIAAGETLRELHLEDTLHDQRNENRDSDHGTPSIPPTLATDNAIDATVSIALQPECSTSMDPSSARMSDTNTEDTRKEAGETVAKAALANEEPTQMKLTPHADVQASPTNELQQESTDTRNTGRETAGQSIQNRELADPDTNDHPTTEAKSVPRSPKRKVKKGGKSATPKKTKAEAHVDDRPSSQSTAVEVASAARLPAQASFPEDHANVEDPLLLYQQEVTRSFLRRVSSRKVLESESVSIRPPSCREQVERGDQLGSTMSATAKAATDVETQLEESVKVREDNDGDSASPLEHESSQVLNDCDSTVEMRSATTEEPAPIPPTIESAVTDFNAKQEKGDLLGVAIQASGQEVPDNTNDVTSGDHEALAEEQLVPTTTDNLTPQTKPDANEVVDQDFMLPPAEHHRATRKIQGQYRCFVRRRLILDQLRFMLAKERRQARRKKAKKVKTGDTVASESESPVATVAVAVDTINVQAQQVAPDSVSREIGAEMSPRALASEEAEPSKEDAMLRARKDSCEYAFDLFDGSKDTSGEDTVFVEAPAALPGTSDDTTTSSPPTSMMLAELAFSDDTEEPTGTVLIETSVTADAAEVQPHWERYVDSTTSKSFYYNPATNETRWAAPADPDYAGIISHPPHTTATADVPTSGQPKEWQEFLDEASGQMFYYNTKTGESSWEPPADGSAEVVALPQSEATAESAASAWVMYIDPASQAPYYVNVKTLVTSWERPADFAAMKPRAMNAAGEDTYSIAV